MDLLDQVLQYLDDHQCARAVETRTETSYSCALRWADGKGAMLQHRNGQFTRFSIAYKGTNRFYDIKSEGDIHTQFERLKRFVEHGPTLNKNNKQ
jgi:hypothetical protein